MATEIRERTPDDIRELKHENNERLRNAFDEIFAKYGHDFSAVGDEIDLTTGEVVVDNGHLQRMRDERDTGTAAPAFLRDWAKDVTVNDVQTQQNHHGAEDEEDGWEDMDEEEAQREAQNVERRVDTRLVDELASDDIEITMESPSRPLPALQDAHEPNVGRERIPQASPNSRKTHSHSPQKERVPIPMLNLVDQFPPVFDRKVVEAFSENLANQITDFIMYMTSSIQQQVSNPELANNILTRQSTGYSESLQSTGLSSKRRRMEDDINASVLSPARNPLLQARLQSLRSDPKGHGHRGLTPGMPSLWSEDETDYYARKRRKKTANKSLPRPLQSSSLRNEVAATDEPTENNIPVEIISSSEDSDDEMFISSRLARSPLSNQSTPQRSVSKLPKAGKPRRTYHKRTRRPFTTKDDIKMIDLYYKGLNWDEITEQFPGVSKSQIRYHFQKNLAQGEGHAMTYAPRPNIFTPPQSPSRNTSEEPEQEAPVLLIKKVSKKESRAEKRSKAKSKSVTFADPSAPTTSLNNPPGYSMYGNAYSQQPFHPMHYPSIPPPHMYGAPAAYGMPPHPTTMAPSMTLNTAQPFGYGNDETVEPVQFLKAPAQRPGS